VDERIEAILKGDLSHLDTVPGPSLELVIARSAKAKRGTDLLRVNTAALAEKTRRFREWESTGDPDGPHTAAAKSAIAAGDDLDLLHRALRLSRDTRHSMLAGTVGDVVVQQITDELADLDRALALVEAAKRPSGDGADTEAAPEVAGARA
jgi:hypothetical protein